MSDVLHPVRIQIPCSTHTAGENAAPCPLLFVADTHPSADRKGPRIFPCSGWPVSYLFLCSSVALAAGPGQHPWPSLIVKAGGCCSQGSEAGNANTAAKRWRRGTVTGEAGWGRAPGAPAQGQSCSDTRGCWFCLSFLCVGMGKGLVLLRRAEQCFVAAVVCSSIPPGSLPTCAWNDGEAPALFLCTSQTFVGALCACV